MMATLMSNYKYDIAISLCKEDVAFARKLVDAINPNLKIFFYENKQEELINKSGPEAFAKIFKEESRVVVILSRKEWSETFYTEIEKNAITDRFSTEGLGFLFVIPLVPKQKPIWYPETRIYADPTRFSIEQLATFIEFKVTEQGGEVKPLKFDERVAALMSKIKQKKTFIYEQKKPEAIEETRKEITIFKELVHNKYETEIAPSGFSVAYEPYNLSSNKIKIVINDMLLTIHINEPQPHIISRTSQAFSLYFAIENLRSQTHISNSTFYRYAYEKQNSGWAEAIDIDASKVYDHTRELLFTNFSNTGFYDLHGRLSSNDLIEIWFNKLLDAVTTDLAKHIN
jgi:hypothetical protein